MSTLEFLTDGHVPGFVALLLFALGYAIASRRAIARGFISGLLTAQCRRRGGHVYAPEATAANGYVTRTCQRCGLPDVLVDFDKPFKPPSG